MVFCCWLNYPDATRNRHGSETQGLTPNVYVQSFLRSFFVHCNVVFIACTCVWALVCVQYMCYIRDHHISCLMHAARHFSCTYCAWLVDVDEELYTAQHFCHCQRGVTKGCNYAHIPLWCHACLLSLMICSVTCLPLYIKVEESCIFLLENGWSFFSIKSMKYHKYHMHIVMHCNATVTVYIQ